MNRKDSNTSSLADDLFAFGVAMNEAKAAELRVFAAIRQSVRLEEEPRVRSTEDVTYCDQGCGAYVVSLRDHAPRRWTCPHCECLQLDAYYNAPPPRR